jgi:hypothetical protein
MKKYKIFKIKWLKLDIEIRYCPEWSKAAHYSHLEIECEVPLPITPTGYLSHFVPGTVEDPVKFFVEWL